jgi:hypothetical protein
MGSNIMALGKPSTPSGTAGSPPPRQYLGDKPKRDEQAHDEHRYSPRFEAACADSERLRRLA